MPAVRLNSLSNEKTDEMMRFFVAAFSGAVLASQAVAADLPKALALDEKPFLRAEEAWNGFYEGLAAGLSRNAIQGATLASDGTTFARTVRESADERLRGANGGLYLGVQKQISPIFVMGVEGDFTRLGGKSLVADTVQSANTWQGQTSAEISYRAAWLATGRVRSGVVFGSVMPYLTGGVAFSSEHEKRTQYVGNSTTSLTEVSFVETDRKLRVGWSLGAGVEWRMSQAWSLRAEYLQARFAGNVFKFPDARGGVVPTSGYLTVQGRLANNRSRIDLGRVGISYYF